MRGCQEHTDGADHTGQPLMNQITISPEDLEELKIAKRLLENPGLAAKLTNLLGEPIEKGMQLLPEKWSARVHNAVEKSLRSALEVAVMTMNTRKSGSSRDRLHKVAAVGAGGVGGAFGLAGLTVELPISTTIMLRSIADIARHEQEDLSRVEGRLACLEVFALGGRSSSDDAVETGYYGVRAVLAATLSEAAAFIAEQGMVKEGAPAVVRFLSAIASRFGAVVSEKVAAMAVPAIGAAGGALINGVFIGHFQNMARGHFKVRRLERVYGEDAIRRLYESLDRHGEDVPPSPPTGPPPLPTTP